MYAAIREFLFLLSPEKAHYFSMNCLQEVCNIDYLQKLVYQQFSYQHPSLEKEVFGLRFKNPVGLGAGFDKNAMYIKELAALGFGFVEIGTVTPKPQLGNLKPRLFRLPKDKALINRMGFNNNGVETIRQRLLQWNNYKIKHAVSPIIVGGNIGKNKITDNENAVKDYEYCFTELFDYVDYFVVNVSSPNTPGLRALQEKDALKKIISQLQNINQSKANPKPILLKIAPDITTQQLDDIIELSFELPLAGIVATNTTTDKSNLITPSSTLHSIGDGGLSGKPLTKKSTNVVQYLTQQSQQKIPIIASGGIFNGADANEKINAGASLVQVWTGFVYEGPSIAKNICKYLATM